MDEQNDTMRAALMQASESLMPVYEWGEGQKALLIERGWSPASAETIAVELVRSMFRAIPGAT